EGDVAAADQYDAPRQLIQFHEFVAGDEVLFTADAERHRLCAAGEEEVASLEVLLIDRHGIAPGQTGAAMVALDALLAERRLPGFRHRIGEAALEAHELRPVELQVAVAHALAGEAPHLVNRLGRADENLLRVAAAQGAGAAEGPVIDDGNRPACRTAALRRHRGRTAAADDDEVVAFSHELFSAFAWGQRQHRGP